jgi:hypothetical protein
MLLFSAFQIYFSKYFKMSLFLNIHWFNIWNLFVNKLSWSLIKCLLKLKNFKIIFLCCVFLTRESLVETGSIVINFCKVTLASYLYEKCFSYYLKKNFLSEMVISNEFSIIMLISFFHVEKQSTNKVLTRCYIFSQTGTI